MKCSFSVYQDNDLTHIAQQILLEDWVDDHNEDLFQISKAHVKNDTVHAVVIGIGVVVADVQQDYTKYIKDRLDSLL